MEKPFPKILSITQATGWVAVFDNEDGTFDRCPVAVWAIIEEGEETRVCGMSQSKEPMLLEDDQMSNFLRWEPA